MPNSTLDDDLTQVADAEEERRDDSGDEGSVRQGKGVKERYDQGKELYDKYKDLKKIQNAARAAQTAASAVSTAASGATATAGAAGAAAGATATAPVWVTVLGVVGAFIAIFAVVGYILVYMGSACNDTSWKGKVADWGSWLSSKFGLTEDICKALNIDQGSNNLAFESSNVETSAILTDAQARALLAQHRIGVNAQQPTTSLQGIRQSTLNEVIWVKQNCRTASGGGCNVVVTGGTEPANHALGNCSHVNGFKFDMRETPEVNAWIQATLAPGGLRGSDLRFINTKSANKSVYVKESTHWDVAVGCYEINE